MQIEFYSSSIDFKVHVVVRWAILAATLKNMVPAIRSIIISIIISIVMVIIEIESSGILPRLKPIIDTIM